MSDVHGTEEAPDVEQPDSTTQNDTGTDGNEVSTELDESSDAAGQPDGQGAEDVDGPGADGVDAADEEPEPKPTRGAQRIAALAERTKAAEERAERVERQLAELTRTRNEQLTEQQEAERLALMTPEERSDYKLEKARREFDQKLGMAHFQAQDQADKVAFSAKVSSNPVFAKYELEVERRLAELRQGNPSKGIPPQNIPRIEMLKWVIGDRALAQAGAGAKAKAKGAARVAQQTVAPAGAKSNAASQRGRQQDSPEKRLEGVPL